MPTRSLPSEDGYTLKGGAPADLARQPADVRRMYWAWVTELGLRAKDKDLSKGLDARGRPLRPISARTRKYRKSAMTPSGKGDPKAPPLTPAYQLSRTRSLLTGRAEADRAEFYWRFDPWTGDTWAKVLEYQKGQGRDVFGLSPAAIRSVMAGALARWEAWKAGKGVQAPRVPAVAQAPPRIERAGSFHFQNITFGIGSASEAARKPGTSSGLRTHAELVASLRKPVRVKIPGRPGTAYNAALRHVWGNPGSGPATPRPATPKPVVPKMPGRPDYSRKPTAGKPTQIVPVKPEIQIAGVAGNLLGHPVNLADLADLAGALPGARVTIDAVPGAIQIWVSGKSGPVTYKATREVRRDRDGTLYLEAVNLSASARKGGLGREIFGRMVEAAQRLGIEEIRADAVRSRNENGYYTWARFGYDGELSAAIVAGLPPGLSGARRISELMATQEGRDWWLANGETMLLTFDLRPGSPDLARWHAYLREKTRPTGP